MKGTVDNAVDAPAVLIAARYRLVRRVGSGGMGVVWEAWDERLHRTVAVKQLHAQIGLSDAEAHLANERAMREARITARLDHPNAVPVFDVVEHDGQPCLIMQFLPSEPLSIVLRERHRLPYAEVARIGAQVASALAAAHRLGIVHRDVKPGNVLIARDGTARISDFGISHALGDVTLTSTGMVHGTPAYLAPEVARGADSAFSSDVFGLGATLYAAVEGAPPFGVSQNSIALLYKVASGDFDPPSADGPLTPLLTRMLAADPEDRPTMGEVSRTLDGLTQAPIVAAPVEPPSTRVLPPIPATTPWVTRSAAEPAESAEPAKPAEPVVESPVPERAVPPAPETAVGPADSAVPPSATLAFSTFPLSDLPTTAAATPTPSDDPAGSASPPTPPDRPAWATAASAPRPPEGDRPRRRLVLALVILVLVVGLVLLLVNVIPTLRQGQLATPLPSGGSSASSSPSVSSASPSPKATTASPSPSRSATSSSPSPSASTATPKPTPAPTTASKSTPPTTSPNKPTAAQLQAALTSYYALVPQNTDAGWARLTSRYQNRRAGTRQSYQRFWDAMASVSISGATGIPPRKAEATITYRMKNGKVSTERTSFRLKEENGVLKIDDSRVLSSSG